jgi:hypothetical protein
MYAVWKHTQRTYIKTFIQTCSWCSCMAWSINQCGVIHEWWWSILYTDTKIYFVCSQFKKHVNQHAYTKHVRAGHGWSIWGHTWMVGPCQCTRVSCWVRATLYLQRESQWVIILHFCVCVCVCVCVYIYIYIYVCACVCGSFYVCDTYTYILGSWGALHNVYSVDISCMHTRHR